MGCESSLIPTQLMLELSMIHFSCRKGRIGLAAKFSRSGQEWSVSPNARKGITAVF